MCSKGCFPVCSLINKPEPEVTTALDVLPVCANVIVDPTIDAVGPHPWSTNRQIKAKYKFLTRGNYEIFIKFEPDIVFKLSKYNLGIYLNSLKKYYVSICQGQ